MSVPGGLPDGAVDTRNHHLERGSKPMECGKAFDNGPLPTFPSFMLLRGVEVPEPRAVGLFLLGLGAAFFGTGDEMDSFAHKAEAHGVKPRIGLGCPSGKVGFL